MKFDHTGTYWWGTCPVTTPDLEIVAAGCSPPWTFSLRFRLADLTGSQARRDTRWVMAHQFRSFWRGFSGRKVSCTRVTRTRRRCNVSGFAGDSVLDGTVTISLKREHSRSASHFRGRVRLINQYCHLVDKRPLSECQTTRRRSGPVYDVA